MNRARCAGQAVSYLKHPLLCQQPSSRASRASCLQGQLNIIAEQACSCWQRCICCLALPHGLLLPLLTFRKQPSFLQIMRPTVQAQPCTMDTCDTQPLPAGGVHCVCHQRHPGGAEACRGARGGQHGQGTCGGPAIPVILASVGVLMTLPKCVVISLHASTSVRPLNPSWVLSST